MDADKGTTFKADLLDVQGLIPERLTRMSERPAFASSNPEDAEHAVAWFALLKEFRGKLDVFEQQG